MEWHCPFCHQPAQPVAVHGHIQCSRCRQNVDPCCGGETACPTPDAESDTPSPAT